MKAAAEQLCNKALLLTYYKMGHAHKLTSLCSKNDTVVRE